MFFFENVILAPSGLFFFFFVFVLTGPLLSGRES